MVEPAGGRAPGTHGAALCLLVTLARRLGEEITCASADNIGTVADAAQLNHCRVGGTKAKRRVLGEEARARKRIEEGFDRLKRQPKRAVVGQRVRIYKFEHGRLVLTESLRISAKRTRRSAAAESVEFPILPRANTHADARFAPMRRSFHRGSDFNARLRLPGCAAMCRCVADSSRLRLSVGLIEPTAALRLKPLKPSLRSIPSN